VNGISSHGLAPLHVACMTGHLKVVEWLLLEGGADVMPSASRPAGATPLHVAAHAGHFDIVKWLVRHGADPNAPAVDGSTALHVACLAGNVRGVHVWASRVSVL
jgi:ankyrin repeat protein